MKKFFTSVIALMLAVTAFAQWNNGETFLMPTGGQYYDQQSKLDANGNLWTWLYTPESISENLYSQIVQCISPEGKKLFGDNGKVLASTRNFSFTTCNEELYPCSDGTMIVIVADCRNQTDATGYLRTYYAYRLDANGNNLWGEEGVLLSDGRPQNPLYHVSVCELPDHSFVFAWEEVKKDGSGMNCIGLQRLSDKGEKMYAEDKTQYTDTQKLYWPTLVTDGADGFFMLYGRTENAYLYVQHFTAEGSTTWSKAFSITRKSTWSGMPMWSMVEAMPTGKGEILVAWRDSRDRGPMFPYLACVDKDGNSKFVNANGTADSRILYDGVQCKSESAMVSPDGKGYVYAVVEEVGSSANSVRIQRVADDSELLLGEGGLNVFEMREHTCDKVNLVPGPDGLVAVEFIERSIYSIDSKELNIVLFDPVKNEVVGNEPIFRYVPSSEIGSVSIFTNEAEKCWMIHFLDAGPVGSKKYDGRQDQKVIRVNFDGTMGVAADGVNTIHVEKTSDNAIYNLQGQRTNMPKGIYILNGKKYIVK